MSWMYLLAAGFFEVTFTYCLKLSENFTNLKWALGFIICGAISFTLLAKAIQTIPLGTAYAIWTGIGAIGTVTMGIVFFNEQAGTIRLFFIFLLIASIVGLKLVS